MEKIHQLKLEYSENITTLFTYHQLSRFLKIKKRGKSLSFLLIIPIR